MGNATTVFGVNFADGRIKGYPKYEPRNRRQGMKKVVRYVRGNPPPYGINSFIDLNVPRLFGYDIVSSNVAEGKVLGQVLTEC
jgi:hypothetical protein